MSDTINYTGQLVVEVCWCGLHHGVPKHLVEHMRSQQRNGEKQTGVYCPLGHSWEFSGPGKAKELEAQLAQARAQLSSARDQLQASEREAERQKARVKGGVCPCCNRSFVQLARHMKTQHPDHGA